MSIADVTLLCSGITEFGGVMGVDQAFPGCRIFNDSVRNKSEPVRAPTTRAKARRALGI